ncbi:hypothetical protein BpHYR1_041726 [Brachionus plicatilis]|uniref:Uncharacterized protein n=1 Tax=Brachionus plicatilis TaxID=10195 RepID=A0A3M7S7D0_BRAPC|nr:hypothetical protein BpHYR1_041726 [Brachionus plicatilis]
MITRVDSKHSIMMEKTSGLQEDLWTCRTCKNTLHPLRRRIRRKGQFCWICLPPKFNKHDSIARFLFNIKFAGREIKVWRNNFPTKTTSLIAATYKEASTNTEESDDSSREFKKMAKAADIINLNTKTTWRLREERDEYSDHVQSVESDKQNFERQFEESREEILLLRTESEQLLKKAQENKDWVEDLTVSKKLQRFPFHRWVAQSQKKQDHRIHYLEIQHILGQTSPSLYLAVLSKFGTAQRIRGHKKRLCFQDHYQMCTARKNFHESESNRCFDCKPVQEHARRMEVFSWAWGSRSRVVDINNTKTKLTEIINELGSSMRESINEIVSLNKRKQKNGNVIRYLKTKKWWDEEMKSLKINVNESYLKWKASNFESMRLEKKLKSDKNKLRAKQREKINHTEDISLKRIDILFNSNRDKFCKEMRRNRKQNEDVNMNIN